MRLTRRVPKECIHMIAARAASHRCAFTLAEMLIALVITALLLTAVAVAMHASLFSYKENEEIASATQTARSILGRMSRDIRTAQAIDYTGGLLTIIPPSGDISEIQYQLVGSSLVYRVTRGGTQTSYDLVGEGDDVQIGSFAIADEDGQDWQGLDCVKSVVISVVFNIGGTQYPFTASARPRRNMVY
jgi:prepilin-type N-terminal cleavage/methylation domain-containing protein